MNLFDYQKFTKFGSRGQFLIEAILVSKASQVYNWEIKNLHQSHLKAVWVLKGLKVYIFGRSVAYRANCQLDRQPYHITCGHKQRDIGLLIKKL